MPKIKITERDMTGQIQQSNISNTVYVPVQINPFFEEDYEDTDIKKQPSGRSTYPILYTSTTKLYNEFIGEDKSEGLVKTTSMDYKICKHLINLGFDVLVQGWITTSTDTTTETDYIAKADLSSKVAVVKQVSRPAGGTWPDSDALTSVSLGIYIDDSETPIDTRPSYDPATGWKNNWTEVNGNGYNQGIFGYPNQSDNESIGNFLSATSDSWNHETLTPVVDPKEYSIDDPVPSSGKTESYSISNPVLPEIPAEDSNHEDSFNYYYGLTDTGEGDPTATKPADSELSATIYCVSKANNIIYLEQGVATATLTVVQTGNVKVGVDDQGWKDLEDKGLYDVRFLTAGMFSCQAMKDDMTACAYKRGDCIALLHADENVKGFKYQPIYAVEDQEVLDPETGEPVIDPETDEPKTVKVEIGYRSNFRVSNGEYAAGFGPWFYSRNSDLGNYNEVTKTIDRVAIPASYGYLFAYANSLKNNPEWYAVAGFQRGIIPELEGVFYNFTTAEIEQLQARAVNEEVDLDDDADNVGFAINPIAYVRPAGYIIWGNRTLRVNDEAKKTIATSFLNVRNGVCAIKKVLYTAARKYTFEQNNEILWTNFRAYTIPLLDRMQSGNGLAGYRWIRLSTTAKARLKAQLRIIPIEAVEDFELEIVLTDDLNVSE